MSDKLKILEHLHINHSVESDNVKIECLWCNSNSLSLDVEPPHQFQCFKCKVTGNAFNLIRKYYESLPKLTPLEAKKLTAMKRGIKPTTLRDEGIRYSDGVYWIPVYSQKGSINALHKYVPEVNIVYNGPKPTSLTLLGLQHLSKSDTVWVAEGHWDYLTLLPYMNGTGIDLIGTSGSYFATNQLPVLKDKHIMLLYDNDIAGANGIEHVARHIKSNSIPILSLGYLDWNKITIPDGSLSEGFDVRDLHNVYHS